MNFEKSHKSFVIQLNHLHRNWRITFWISIGFIQLTMCALLETEKQCVKNRNKIYNYILTKKLPSCKNQLFCTIIKKTKVEIFFHEFLKQLKKYGNLYWNCDTKIWFAYFFTHDEKINSSAYVFFHSWMKKIVVFLHITYIYIHWSFLP